MVGHCASPDIISVISLWIALAGIALAVLGYFVGRRAAVRRPTVPTSDESERLVRLIDGLPLATVAYDADARVIAWNRSAETLFGWSAEEAFGNPNPAIPAAGQTESDEYRRRILAGETLSGVEIERHAADGSVLELSGFSAPLDPKLGPSGGFLVLYDDIRERKRAERERDAAENRFRELVESLPLVTYVDHADDQATNIYTSPQVTELLGWDPVELSTGVISFESLLHPDDTARVMAAVAAANATREPFEEEYRLRHRDGSYIWVRDHSSVIEDVAGQPTGRGFLLDITKQKGLEAQLLQAQKMEALGQFAGGIAHDFNNLLTAISGYADLASNPGMPEASLHRYLEGIATAASEASDLTAQVLSFSRQKTLERRSINLNETARAAAKLLDRFIREDVGVRLELADALPAVMADGDELKQVVLNLALNARDAMEGGGTITIETATTAGSVVLRVRDTGLGMSAGTKARAFEPFFTTKPEGKGPGLGLSVAYGVIEALGGTLTIESILGEGTTVEAVIPATDGAPAEISKPAETPALAGGDEHVVVVEDRKVVRELTRDILVAAGFRVSTAASAHAALALLDDAPSCDVLLTDVVMPEMNGPELAGILRGRIPGLRVLYMSGYTDDILDASALAIPATAFLQKPFQNAEVVAKVRELLDAR